MKYKFSDIVDIPKLQSLMEGLYSLTNILSAILDIDENILVSVGFHEICRNYHRENRETEFLCRQSDALIKKYLKENPDPIEPYIFYTCANGLIDAAAPIIIDGEHLATIFQGQFFFEEPDLEKFRRQARRYGFDEEKYIELVSTVPIYSKEKLDLIMNYFRQLAEMLAQMGLANLKLIESREKSLQESEERLKTIINNTPNVAIQSYDDDGKILFLNKASETLFGWTCDEAIGKSLDQLNFDKKEADQFVKLLKVADETQKPVEPLEWIYKNRDGIEKYVYSTIFPIRFSEGRKEFICMDIDITDKKRFEKEMYRLEQLNLIGEMAAGIGHEVRNPMTAVRGFLQILAERNYPQQDKEYFSLMIEELDRANSIITEFLSLAKNKAILLENKNLNSLITALAPLIAANTTVNNQTLILELNEVSELFLDEKEIRQLILNLSRNANEAMPPGGNLTIKTFQIGNEVVLEVQDDGAGIKPEIIDKIGTPFFSTKDNGTGLGLAVCFSIAARHNAKISVTSASGKTTFSVCFKNTKADIWGI